MEDSIVPIENSLEKPRRGRPRKDGRAKPVDFNEAIVHASQQSQLELETFSKELNKGIEQWRAYQTQKIVDTVRSAPTEVVNAVTQKLTEEVADVATFLEYGATIASIFSIVEQQSETE